MDKSKQDNAGDSVNDSVPVTARILAMHPDAFSGRENLVQQQKQDMLYQKRTDRPTGPISRLLGKPVLVDDQKGHAQKTKDSSSGYESSVNESGKKSDGNEASNLQREQEGRVPAQEASDSASKIQLLDANIRKPDGHATFEEIFPGKKDDVYKALLERMYPKGIPYRVLANGRKTPWAEVKKTISESPTLGTEFEPQTPTTTLGSRG